LAQIFSSTPCSQTPSVYVPLLLSETMFHTQIEPQAKLWFQTHCYSENLAAPGIEHGTSGSAARKSDH
jgi:hypothetical protein